MERLRARSHARLHEHVRVALAIALAVGLASSAALPALATAQPAPRKAAKPAPAATSSTAVAGVALPPAGDASAGRVKAESERCLECHGTPGVGQGNSAGEDGKFARLAGQQQAYIVKQVRDFRAGRRTSEFMAMMANSIGDDDLADIAAYFAAQPPMPAALNAGQAQGAGMPATQATAEAAVMPVAREPVALAQSARAAMLYRLGDPARNIAACAACHGAAGEGKPGVGPVIGGQGRRYLSQQLHNWRSGSRSNGPAMGEAAKTLTDGEIEALALYVSEM